MLLLKFPLKPVNSDTLLEVKNIGGALEFSEHDFDFFLSFSYQWRLDYNAGWGVGCVGSSLRAPVPSQ